MPCLKRITADGRNARQKNFKMLAQEFGLGFQQWMTGVFEWQTGHDDLRQGGPLASNLPKHFGPEKQHAALLHQSIAKIRAEYPSP